MIDGWQKSGSNTMYVQSGAKFENWRYIAPAINLRPPKNRRLQNTNI
jgi:hypothetical protein